MNAPVTSAMVLAAGLGTRMRPLTLTMPKPLVQVGGKALMDWCLDDFAVAGIRTAVVNVHYLADLVRRHVAGRRQPHIVISDETDRLLETGGGIAKAIPLLGADAFIAANTDAFTVGGSMNPVARLAAAWNDDVDALLLLHPLSATHGFDGAGDFDLGPSGTLMPRGASTHAPYAYAGTQLLRPSIFANEPIEPFSMWRIWTRLMKAGRMRGVVQDGQWFHVGTPSAIGSTEAKLRALGHSWTL
jgi:N-acetyl-alpha-D-muramate 1-phosphate uridylyltransferase